EISGLRASVPSAASQPSPSDGIPFDAAGAQASLAEFEQAAASLLAIRDEAFVFLKMDLATRVGTVSDDASFCQVRADRDAVESLVAHLKSAGEECNIRLDALQALIAHLANQQLS